MLLRKPPILGLLWPLLTGLTAYLGLLFYLFFVQDRFVYLPDIPTRELSATPDDIGLDYRQLTLTSEDGVELDGWFLPAEPSRATLLFFHGNAGNISHRLDTLALFHRLGLSVLIIDYRGYGNSGGTPSEAGIYRDAEAAWRYLTQTRGIPPRQILLMGRSFGGAVAAYLASRHQALGLVLESTFSSALAMAEELYPWIPVRWLLRLDYNTLERMARIHMPVMVIHSREDELIPFAQGEILYAAANPPKRMLDLNGNHNEGVVANSARYRSGLDGFIEFCLTEQARTQ